MIRHLIQDIRYSLRALAKRPGFAFTVVVTLALAIGANTAIFSVVRAVLLRPLPFPDPQRLVQVWESRRSKDKDKRPVSPYNLLDWQSQSRSFEQFGAYQNEDFVLTRGAAAEHVKGLLVSPNLLQVLGVAPVLGRAFTPVEGQADGARVVVISHGCWLRLFGGDPKVVDQVITLNDMPYTVVGVMPPAFQFPQPNIELWTPPAFDLQKSTRSGHFLNVIGRLKPGVSLEQAQAEMDTIAGRLSQQYPDTNQDGGILLASLQEQTTGRVRPTLLMLWYAVVGVLLIATVNVANLSLVRAIGRGKETALRIALGASRARLVRQFLTESLLLACLGGALGLALAWWGGALIVSYGTQVIPRSDSIGIDLSVLGFTAVISVITGLLFGLVPALAYSRTDLTTYLKIGAARANAGAGRLRGRMLLVTSEIALTLMLLVSAGLLIKSFWLLRGADPGFNPDRVLTMQLTLPEARYPKGQQRSAFCQSLAERLAALPGVEAAGIVNDLPLSGSRTRGSFEVEGPGPAPAVGEAIADFRIVSDRYFEAMGIPLLEGRAFSANDRQNAPPVVIINEYMARRYLGGRNPVGSRLKAKGKVFEVVGVVGSLKHESLTSEDGAEMYVPYPQADSPSWAFVAMRSALPARQLVASAREVIREADPGIPVYGVQTMEERLTNSLGRQRFSAVLLGALGAVALALALVGIYGVINYVVTQRTKEIGVRVALGARPGDIKRLVLKQGAAYIVPGVALGLGGAVVITRTLSSMLYGVAPNDPLTFVCASLLLTCAALAANYIPARRATKIESVEALRQE